MLTRGDSKKVISALNKEWEAVAHRSDCEKLWSRSGAGLSREISKTLFRIGMTISVLNKTEPDTEIQTMGCRFASACGGTSFKLNGLWRKGTPPSPEDARYVLEDLLEYLGIPVPDDDGILSDYLPSEEWWEHEEERLGM